MWRAAEIAIQHNFNNTRFDAHQQYTLLRQDIPFRHDSSLPTRFATRVTNRVKLDVVPTRVVSPTQFGTPEWQIQLKGTRHDLSLVGQIVSNSMFCLLDLSLRHQLSLRGDKSSWKVHSVHGLSLLCQHHSIFFFFFISPAPPFFSQPWYNP